MRDLMSVDFRRVKNLLHMDFHRVLHGKAFWVMVGITVFIPIMMLTQMSDVHDLATFIGGDSSAAGFSFGAGMSLSILIVLTGILLCIYIGKEYTSGQIKNIITSHANKCDYIFAKTVIAFLWTSVFNVIYLLTLFVLGMVMDIPAGIASIPSLILFVLEKLLLSIPMSVLMIAINLIFREKYGWSILFTCIVGTGVIVMFLKMGLQMLGLEALSGILNFTITGAAAFASLTPAVSSILVILAVTVVWTLLCTLLSDGLMNKRDVL